MKDGKFEPFEKVLMRDNDEAEWRAVFFSRYEKSSMKAHYITTGDMHYNQCVPYEGNESLVGTTDNPKEPERFKFGDKVQVSNYGKEWFNAIFFRYSISKEYPYKVITEESMDTYKECRKADW